MAEALYSTNAIVIFQSFDVNAVDTTRQYCRTHSRLFIRHSPNNDNEEKQNGDYY